MIVRKVHPNMPTSTVALDLLSRVGSPTKYSLSPYAGYANERFKINGYSDFRADASFEKFIRIKDVFKFTHDKVCYTLLEKEGDFAIEEDDWDDEDSDEIEEADTNEDSVSSSSYVVGDKHGPKYVRRFEDYTATERITEYLKIIIRNAMKNSVGYYKTKDLVAYNVSGGDDDEEVNINELAVEDVGDMDEYSMQRISRESLIRSMYRLNLLSREVGINVVSVLLSFCRYRGTKSSKVQGKPQFLVDNGPVYVADAVRGECVCELTNPNDRALTNVRDVIWPVMNRQNRFVEEFHDDCWTFIKCITNLNINARACDARKYTWNWINFYSRKVLINNYAYVCRKIGGYNMDVLNTLKSISLDAAVHQIIEEEVDTYTNVLNLIESAVELDARSFPPEVYQALRKRTSNNVVNTCYDIAQTLVNYEKYTGRGETIAIVQAGEVFSTSTTEEGFLLNKSGSDLFKFRFKEFLSDTFDRYLTGYAFVHCTGWIVFESMTTVTVIMKLETVRDWILQDMPYASCPKLVIGPGRDNV